MQFKLIPVRWRVCPVALPCVIDLQVTDADVIKFLRMLTFLPLEDINALEAAMAQPDYVPNTAQRQLAEAVTRCDFVCWS